MKARKKRRQGASQTIGVSLPPETKRKLKELAKQRTGGNVSALITEMTEAAARHAAIGRLWAWAGLPEPTEAQNAAIDRQLEEAGILPRTRPAKRTRRKKAA